MIIGPSNNMARVTATNTGPGAADPTATDAFNALMGTSAPNGAAAKPLATDAQINSLSKGELDRLREKWGANEVGFREDAYNAWKFGQAYQNTVIQQMFQESYTRTRDIVNEQRR